ncbi:MAG: protein kinase [Candidatus Solibacter sp.]
MPLPAGARLGHYTMGPPIGSGAMGEVYRARDTRLDREVAIKVLPAAVAQDSERLGRFAREAKVLAALNHPHIAQVYGFEEDGETRALVMELVNGSTLPVPVAVELAVEYAIQIAEALEAAHEKGITHRDLKPDNIMVTSEGVVKVLDFGLATTPARGAAAGAGGTATMTMQATLSGMIVGTAAYMSPEQASGLAVDHRSDIWSFGVVLWEMVTGTRLFEGETLSHTLADVLRAPIEWGRIPASVPEAVTSLLRRCLERNVKVRLQAIGEARIALQKYREDVKNGVMPARAASPGQGRSAKVAWGVAAALLLAVGGLSVVAYRHAQEPPPRLLKTFLLPPDKASFALDSPPALSPDGRKIAFAALQDGQSMLWVRDLDSLAARSITGTEGASTPFWSPDSRSLGFSASGNLKRVEIAGGAAVTLAPADGNVHGASWSSRGDIVFPRAGVGPLYRISESGGTAVPVTAMDGQAGEVSHRLPWFLPDGRHFLYTARHRESVDRGAIYVGDLDSKERTLVMRGAGHAQYVATAGLMVYTERGIDESVLMTRRFDIKSFQLSGEARPVAESVDQSIAIWAQHQFSVTQEGSLVYMGNGPGNNARLTWFDRTGKALGVVGDSNSATAAISPDGRTVALEAWGVLSRDIWLHDVAKGTSSRFTFQREGTRAQQPAWSPDGGSLIFCRVEEGKAAVLVKSTIASGASAELTTGTWGETPRTTTLPSWSRDGKYVVARLNPSGTTGSDLWMLRLDEAGEKPRPYLAGPANEGQPAISPSGEWLAYSSDETRRMEIYVQSFPNPGVKYQLSIGGGEKPVWRRDGKELYYVTAGRKMMAVPVKSDHGRLEIGKPEALFDSRIDPRPSVRFDVGPDGRFLIPVQPLEGALPMTLVTNFPLGLR